MTGAVSAGERARLLRRVAPGRAAPARGGGRDRAPATYAQEQLWFLDQLSPRNPNYNVPFVFRLTGPLDVAALRTALTMVASRHTALRTVLGHDGGGLTQVVAEPSDVPLPLEDLSRAADPDDTARRRCAELVREPFTLTEPPLWRARLLRVRDAEHLLVWVASHAVADGWAVGLLSQELAGCYRAARGAGDPLPPPTWQLTDFAVAQRARLDARRTEELLDFWQRALADCPPPRFPYDHPRPPVPSFRGATHRFAVSGDLAARLSEVAADLGTTPFATALAGYCLLRSAYCGQHDVAVGVPVAGRDEPETQSLFGSLVNTVVVRADLSGDPTFATLVRRVTAAALDAYDHAELPFGKLVEHLRPTRADRFSPLVQTVFSYGSTPFTERATTMDGGVGVELTGVSNGTVRFDVELALDQSPDGWQGRLEYAVDLMTEDSARLLCDRYVRLLSSALHDPDQPLSRVVATARADDPSWPAPTAPEQATDKTPSPQDGPAPDDDVEQTLLRLWREALGTETLDPTDDFFSAGGHSMLAAELVATIRETLGCELSLVEFFQALTVRELARLLTPRLPDGPHPEIPADILRRVADLSDEEVAELLSRIG